MFERKWTAAVLSVLLVASAGLAGAATAASNDQTAQTEGSAYAGTHVTANMTGDALVDYRVDGTTVMESVRVQSTSEAKTGTDLSVGADLSTRTGFAGAGLSMDARSETSASVTAESGAELTVHDNGHGSLVVAANGQSQYVGLNLSESATAQQEGDARVVVTQDDGTQSSILVAGNGSVAVNDEGNVTAKIEEDSRLIVRTYEDRDEDDRNQEQLIQNGTAAAQVYLTQQAEGSSEAAVDVVDYGQNTTVEVTQRTKGNVEMTVERTASQGKVVITSVSNETFDAVGDIQVQVDSQAAVEASSYSELAAAADGGPTSKYMVRQTGSAEAGTDVLVALNHFSQRSVTMTEDSADSTNDSTDSTATPTDDDTPSGDSTADDTPVDDSENTADETPSGGEDTSGESGPGFTGLLALLAIVATIAVGLRRS